MSYPVDDVCVPSSSRRVLYCSRLVEERRPKEKQDINNFVSVDGAWFIFHFLTFAIPVLETFYLSDSLISVLVPVAGRNGLNTNPDLLIAMVMAALTLLISSFAVCSCIFIISSQRNETYFWVFWHIFFSSPSCRWPAWFATVDSFYSC